MPGGIIFEYPDLYLFPSGLWLTVQLSVISLLGSVVIGTLIAIFRISPLAPLRWIGTGFVEFFRNTPVLVQILWFYYALPILLPFEINPLTAAALGISLNSAAFSAEIYRGGIESIDRGQAEAARALGMTPAQAMRRIVLPQALRRMVPALVNEMVTLVKDSSLVSAIGLAELALAARTVAGAYSRYWEPYLFISAIYLVITLTLSALAKRLEAPVHQRGK